MNLSNDNKILQDVRELIRDNILPRITQLEEEVRMLRYVTWPVCQSLRETSQLSDIGSKKRFFSILDEDEVNLLLKEKSKISIQPVQYSTFNFLKEEHTCLERDQ